jgi:putative beta-lysine N-acetyltransferase
LCPKTTKEFNEETIRMSDTITTIGKGSLIQHGKENDRVYLMKLIPEDTPVVLDEIERLAIQHNYAKLFCKVPKKVSPSFLARGYILEGVIPLFYKGEEDAFLVSKYLKAERLLSAPSALLDRLKELLSGYTPEGTISEKIKEQSAYTIRKLTEQDIPQMIAIYSEVFQSYPFPINDPDYLAETMHEHVQYFGAFKGNELAALSSSEIDFEAQNAEMTDFATSKEHTGHNLSCLLLREMEKAMREQNIKTLYTIARLKSIPMNKTFLKLGYEYSGTLINNTNIAGDIESMNLYYKNI